MMILDADFVRYLCIFNFKSQRWERGRFAAGLEMGGRKLIRVYQGFYFKKTSIDPWDNIYRASH